MNIFEFIKALETDSTFFGMILQISSSEDTSYKVAYERIEDIRLSIGMRRRFKNYLTFLIMKQKFHKANGQVVFFDYRRYIHLLPKP